VDDLIIHRHFHIELATDRLPQDLGITVLDVAAIFAKVECDAIRPSQLRLGSRPDRVWFHGLAGLPDGCNVVNVYA
jgi:hypothetical protein